MDHEDEKEDQPRIAPALPGKAKLLLRHRLAVGAALAFAFTVVFTFGGAAAALALAGVLAFAGVFILLGLGGLLAAVGGFVPTGVLRHHVGGGPGYKSCEGSAHQKSP